MITCPHCQKNLQFNESYKRKLQQALNGLEQGKRLTIKCTQCKRPVMLDRNSFIPAPGGVEPPSPPNIDWLKEERLVDNDDVDDLPMALLLYPESPGQKEFRDTLESIGYQVITADSTQQAQQRLNQLNFFCIIYHAGFEEGALDDSAFHQYMRQMPMQKRRFIFYILVGPNLNTLYELEAMANSANLVINEKDIKFLDTVLRKAITAYEQMFGPVMEELKAHGRA